MTLLLDPIHYDLHVHIHQVIQFLSLNSIGYLPIIHNVYFQIVINVV